MKDAAANTLPVNSQMISADTSSIVRQNIDGKYRRVQSTAHFQINTRRLRNERASNPK